VKEDSYYTVRVDWDSLGARYTVCKRNQVEIITRDYMLIKRMFPKFWMDTTDIPETIWV
jgi:hypothetical protein